MTISPSALSHRLEEQAQTVRAIVETPAGSAGKFSLDPDTGLYSLAKLLPVGMAMPLDFGFVPSTCGGDGDPLDIMLLNEVEIPTGCLVTARLIGAIEVEQAPSGDTSKKERNDRLIARLAESRKWAHVERLEQLGEAFVDELNRFFSTYKALRGQTYEVQAVSGPGRAVELVNYWSRK